MFRLVREPRRLGLVSHRSGDDTRRLRGGIPRGGIVEVGVDRGGAALAVPEQPPHRGQPLANPNTRLSRCSLTSRGELKNRSPRSRAYRRSLPGRATPARWGERIDIAT